jgi:hypothetical protein
MSANRLAKNCWRFTAKGAGNEAFSRQIIAAEAADVLQPGVLQRHQKHGADLARPF